MDVVGFRGNHREIDRTLSNRSMVNEANALIGVIQSHLYPGKCLGIIIRHRLL